MSGGRAAAAAGGGAGGVDVDVTVVWPETTVPILTATNVASKATNNERDSVLNTSSSFTRSGTGTNGFTGKQCTALPRGGRRQRIPALNAQHPLRRALRPS